MEISTTRDLERFLKQHHHSPETLAPQVKISSMTLRRLLKKSPDAVIPEKYQASLNLHAQLISSSLENRDKSTPEMVASLVNLNSTSFSGLLEELEQSGSKCQDLEKLQVDTNTKLKDTNIGKDLKGQVASVLQNVFGSNVSFRVRALSIGGILYFLNPFDLIPDSIPVVGYLDDFAVLALVIATTLKWKSAEQRSNDLTSGKNQ